MSYYECKRCNYKTKLKPDMKRHINRKVKCPRTIKSYDFTDEELYNDSLKLNKCLSENTYDIEDLLCNVCNKFFSRKDILKRHINKYHLDYDYNKKTDECTHDDINTCIKSTIHSDKNIASDNNNVIESHNMADSNNMTESHNMAESHNNIATESHNTNNIGDENISGEHNTVAHEHSNIINGDQNSITINNYMVLPFDDKWSTSHIDKYFKVFLLNTYRKYTNFIEKVLENDENLNVIIDENSDKSLVYKNNTEKYVMMKNHEILEKTMEKANKQVSDIFDNVIETEVISNLSKENFKKEKKDFCNKYMDYIKSHRLKENVNELLTDLYSKKREMALDICKKMNEIDNDKDHDKKLAELEEKLKRDELNQELGY